MAREQTVAACCFEDLIRENADEQAWRAEIFNCRQSMDDDQVLAAITEAVEDMTPPAVARALFAMFSV